MEWRIISALGDHRSANLVALDFHLLVLEQKIGKRDHADSLLESGIVRFLILMFGIVKRQAASVSVSSFR